MTPSDADPTENNTVLHHTVLHHEDENVSVNEVVYVGRCRKPITKEIVESLATEKYRINGKGLTIRDLITKFSVKKSKAQRSFKYFHSIGILFTAQDLIRQGIDLLQNKNPQDYYATCIKGEIIENLKETKICTSSSHGGQPPKRLHLSTLQCYRTPESPYVPRSFSSTCLCPTIHTQITTDVSSKYGILW